MPNIGAWGDTRAFILSVSTNQTPLVDATALLADLERIGHPRVLVVGDFILDRYTWGNADRVSQEAPVILLRADRVID